MGGCPSLPVVEGPLRRSSKFSRDNDYTTSIFDNLKDMSGENFETVCGYRKTKKNGEDGEEAELPVIKESYDCYSPFAMERSQSTKLEELSPDYPNVFRLDRDGVIVQSITHGAIQIGIPPESIKDCMKHGLEVPTYYIIFGEMFDRASGLSTAEFEFPIYFNYFVKKRKVTILTTKALEERIRTAFQETLFGPQLTPQDLAKDFSARVPTDAYPNFFGEGVGLDSSRRTLSLEDLLEFRRLEEYKETKLGNDISIKILKKLVSGQFVSMFTISEFGECIAEVPVNFEMKTRPTPVIKDKTNLFTAPVFGVTVLGSSHGFDPTGNTTGFVIWINRLGIMVDPPPDSSKVLEELGIAPCRIQGIILTHCHADHDAGTFQKILRQSQVKLYTTTTIKSSFLRKYAAITGFSITFLESLFDFKPVQIGKPLQFGCANINFFYSMHTIPCIGFDVQWKDSRIVYSADTNYSPELIEALHKENIIGKQRKENLLNFPWDSTIVLHEMGVPPIHTSQKALLKQCEETPSLRDRLYVVHTSNLNSDTFQQLRELDTLSIPTNRCRKCVAQEILETLRSIAFLRPIRQNKAAFRKVCAAGEVVYFKKGDHIVKRGATNDALWVMLNGKAEMREGSGAPKSPKCCAKREPSKNDDMSQFSIREEEETDDLRTISGGCEQKITEEGTVAESKELSAGDGRVDNVDQVSEESSFVGVIQPLYPASHFGEESILDLLDHPKKFPDISSSPCTVVAQTSVTLVRFPTDKLVALLKSLPNFNQMVEGLRIPRDADTKDALDTITCNEALDQIVSEQLCKNEFLKLFRKAESFRGESLPDPCIVVSGTVAVTAKETNAGTFRGISVTNVELNPQRGVGRGAFISDINKIVKGEPTTLDIKAETQGTYLKCDPEALKEFLNHYPGVLLQMLDTKIIAERKRVHSNKRF